MEWWWIFVFTQYILHWFLSVVQSMPAQDNWIRLRQAYTTICYNQITWNIQEHTQPTWKTQYNHSATHSVWTHISSDQERKKRRNKTKSHGPQVPLNGSNQCTHCLWFVLLSSIFCIIQVPPSSLFNFDSWKRQWVLPLTWLCQRVLHLIDTNNLGRKRVSVIRR